MWFISALLFNDAHYFSNLEITAGLCGLKATLKYKQADHSHCLGEISILNLKTKSQLFGPHSLKKKESQDVHVCKMRDG